MFRILVNSFKLSLQELKVNKLRTILSLTGIAFGIFCIIGVLTTVNSLETNIQNEVKNLGSSTIYIDKWDYSGTSSAPRWKQRAWPTPKFEEATLIRTRTDLLDQIAYLFQTGSNVSYRDDVITGIAMYGITEQQIDIAPIKFAAGRYLTRTEFDNGSAVCIIGFDIAENFFRSADNALEKQVEVQGKRLTVVGVIAKEGKTFVGWEYDNCVMIPYTVAKQYFNEDWSNPILIAKGKENIDEEKFSNELTGVMRQVRRLSPGEENNFSMNSVAGFSKSISDSFVFLNLVGGIIGGISLVVGMFGIANIMFVTVKERTPIIGLKKAIGAKRSTILLEFLIEAAILCIMGGTVGIILVFILTKILSGPLEFPVFISFPMLIITFIICLVVGIIAGILPASRAAKLDPVVAIRS